MRPDAAELGLLAGEADDVIDGLPGQLRLALGQEEPDPDHACGQRACGPAQPPVCSPAGSQNCALSH